MAAREIPPGERAVLDEPARLTAVAETGLGAGPDAALDALAERVCRRLDVPMALVALVNDHEQVFPGLAGLGQPWAGTRRAPLSAPLCPGQLMTGEPLVLDDAGALDDLAVTEPGIGSCAGLPLTDSAGRILGGLVVFDHRVRRWREEELAALADAAHTCCLELRLRIATAGSGRERPDGMSETLLREAFTRSQLLLAASQALAHASDLDEVRATVTDLVSGDLKPAYVGLTLTEGYRGLHRIDDPLQAVGPESGEPVSDLQDDTPIALTAREATLQLYPDPAAIAAAFPVTAQRRYADLGLHAIACAPLPGQDGVAGVLLFGWDTPHEVDVVEQAVITTLAGYVGHALDRTSFLQHRITVARQLQEAMLTSLPEVDGVRLGARYVPSGELEQVGGDWYDALELSSVTAAEHDTLVLVVGDITGHDIHAATLMGQVRSMSRQATWERPAGPPSAVLAAVEQACAATAVGATGTVLQAHLRPEPGGRWRMRWACAGHPPPIVRHQDATTTVLPGADLVFGYPDLRDTPLTDHEVLLVPGDTVVLYTDGLIERRGSDLGAGTSRLQDTIAGLDPADPDTFVDECIHTMLGSAGHYRDDVVVLAMHLPPAGEPQASRKRGQYS